MMKKIVVSTVVLFIIGGSSTVVYGNPGVISTTLPEGTSTQETKAEEINKEQEALKIIAPSRRDLVANDSDMVVSNSDLVLAFTAPEGTTVTIDVYHNTSVATSKPNYEKAYEPIEVKIGALKRGWAEIELRKGLNKIDFTAVYTNGFRNVISRIIEVKDIDEVKQRVEQGIASTSSTDAIRSIVNTERKQ